MGAVWHEKGKTDGGGPSGPCGGRRKRTLTLCGEPVLEETLAWPEFEGKGRAVRRMTGYYRRLVRSCRLRWERETYCLALLAAGRLAGRSPGSSGPGRQG